MTFEQRKRLYQHLKKSYYEQPYEKIYNLISFADLDLIADDSTWMCKETHTPLQMLLVSEKINKIIWIEHSHNGKYSIMVKKTDDERENLPFYEEFKKDFFSTEDELYTRLRKELYPCLRKKKFSKIENRGVVRKYKTSLELLYTDRNYDLDNE